MKNVLFFVLVAIGIKIIAYGFGLLKHWSWFVGIYQKYWYVQSGFVLAMTLCFCVMIYMLYKLLGINRKIKS